MIIQGSNSPLVLTFESDMSNVTEFSAALIKANSNVILKRWLKSDIEIATVDVALPLTQKETFYFPAGTHTLEIKWVDENEIRFAEAISIEVVQRLDKERFTIEG